MNIFLDAKSNQFFSLGKVRMRWTDIVSGSGNDYLLRMKVTSKYCPQINL